MTYAGAQIDITDTGIVEVASSTGNGPASLWIQYVTTGPCYLGEATVTTAGFAFTTAYQPLQMALMPGETLYGASTCDVTLTVLKHYDW